MVVIGECCLVSKYLIEMRKVIINIETTGLDPKKDRIVGIACIALRKNKKTSKKFNSLINPQIKISSKIAKLISITNEQVKDKPRFSQIAPEFLKFVIDSKLVCFNSRFDILFLDAELKRLNLPSIKTICEIEDMYDWARERFPEYRNAFGNIIDRLGLNRYKTSFNVEFEQNDTGNYFETYAEGMAEMYEILFPRGDISFRRVNEKDFSKKTNDHIEGLLKGKLTESIPIQGKIPREDKEGNFHILAKKVLSISENLSENVEHTDISSNVNVPEDFSRYIKSDVFEEDLLKRLGVFFGHIEDYFSGRLTKPVRKRIVDSILVEYLKYHYPILNRIRSFLGCNIYNEIKNKKVENLFIESSGLISGIHQNGKIYFSCFFYKKNLEIKPVLKKDGKKQYKVSLAKGLSESRERGIFQEFIQKYANYEKIRIASNKIFVGKQHLDDLAESVNEELKISKFEKSNASFTIEEKAFRAIEDDNGLYVLVCRKKTSLDFSLEFEAIKATTEQIAGLGVFTDYPPRGLIKDYTLEVIKDSKKNLNTLRKIIDSQAAKKGIFLTKGKTIIKTENLFFVVNKHFSNFGYPILKHDFPNSMSMSRIKRRYQPEMDVIIHNHLFKKISSFNMKYFEKSYNDIRIVFDFFSNYNLPQILNDSIEFNDAFLVECLSLLSMQAAEEGKSEQGSLNIFANRYFYEQPIEREPGKDNRPLYSKLRDVRAIRGHLPTIRKSSTRFNILKTNNCRNLLSILFKNIGHIDQKSFKRSLAGTEELTYKPNSDPRSFDSRDRQDSNLDKSKSKIIISLINGFEKTIAKKRIKNKSKEIFEWLEMEKKCFYQGYYSNYESQEGKASAKKINIFEEYNNRRSSVEIINIFKTFHESYFLSHGGREPVKERVKKVRKMVKEFKENLHKEELERLKGLTKTERKAEEIRLKVSEELTGFSRINRGILKYKHKLGYGDEKKNISKYLTDSYYKDLGELRDLYRDCIEIERKIARYQKEIASAKKQKKYSYKNEISRLENKISSCKDSIENLIPSMRKWIIRQKIQELESYEKFDLDIFKNKRSKNKSKDLWFLYPDFGPRGFRLTALYKQSYDDELIDSFNQFHEIADIGGSEMRLAIHDIVIENISLLKKNIASSESKKLNKTKRSVPFGLGHNISQEELERRYKDVDINDQKYMLRFYEFVSDFIMFEKVIQSDKYFYNLCDSMFRVSLFVNGINPFRNAFPLNEAYERIKADIDYIINFFRSLLWRSYDNLEIVLELAPLLQETEGRNLSNLKDVIPVSNLDFCPSYLSTIWIATSHFCNIRDYIELFEKYDLYGIKPFKIMGKIDEDPDMVNIPRSDANYIFRRSEINKTITLKNLEDYLQKNKVPFYKEKGGDREMLKTNIKRTESRGLKCIDKYSLLSFLSSRNDYRKFKPLITLKEEFAEEQSYLHQDHPWSSKDLSNSHVMTIKEIADFIKS